ncbi:NAD-dependent succinate-semialdehyde dehydrogenase [Caulobacter sp. 17J80-11]|uniref:NAD-dependent succinate-semialdehyde dehydrogenase n=1 Tax=Caulobacter sp. 17J80-11 TaxID=2763502 RepID=UPI0016536E50|nr:NAD-dependent succinate-semialdehyde dehydrogenase [Caulobacter sp. 17J80-11]MBC6983169.1 NAD-dependent succinate-semialdehyde dehydrogenase [Caulobacter sp. 17J80-11]
MDDADAAGAQALKAQGRALIQECAFVAGRRVAPADGACIEVEDPAEETVLGVAPDLPAEEVESAIRAAAEAFPAWSRTPQAQRAACLRRWAALVDDNEAGLAALLSLENGKPFEEARGEVRYANGFIKWFAGVAEELRGEVAESPLPGHTILTFREAVGPVAVITPWNFPAAMITRKLAAAFAAGCTAVVKPASQTPFTAIALCELALEAGVPEGAFSVVTGESGRIGKLLTASPLIRKLSFTGSTPVGRRLMEQCAPTLKRLSMELGGAAPMVVFEDADLDVAVAETLKGKFRNAGQTCVCPNRVYVQRELFAAFVEQLADAVANLAVGGPFEPGVKVGPLIDAKAVARVEEHVRLARASGAEAVVGGDRHARGGRFFQPTVLAGGDDELFRREETFGPVVPVFAFDDEAEALAGSNNSEFGLAAFVFTRDLDRAFRFARGLEDGIVGVNAGLISNPVVPFGGVKQSGFGREGSVHGIDAYLSVKSVTLALR